MKVCIRMRERRKRNRRNKMEEEKQEKKKKAIGAEIKKNQTKKGMGEEG